MNDTNDFIGTLLNNRKRIVEKLVQNYSYDHLIKLFIEINLERDERINISPNDRHVYRMLSGKFDGSLYDKSSIEWIPSEELIDGILDIANYFNIIHIEELYCGMGILSALLKEKDKRRIITTADTFDNIDTCNKLDLLPIAKRSAIDFKYYEQLNEPYPQMIISSYYPSIPSLQKNIYDNYMEQITTLIHSKKHSIIILFMPLTFTYFYSIFYHLVNNSEYFLYTYHVKAIDKYFYLANLMKKEYPSFMLAHIFIKNNVLLQSKKTMCDVFDKAIIPKLTIDTHCSLLKRLVYLYHKVSPKLIKNVYRSYDLTKTIAKNNDLKVIIEYIVDLEQKNITKIPQYIYDTREFIFWSKCACKGLYFIFDNRNDFFDFITRVSNMEHDSTRPSWIRNNLDMYKYIYMDIVDRTITQQNSLRILIDSFRRINELNRQKLTQN